MIVYTDPAKDGGEPSFIILWELQGVSYNRYNVSKGDPGAKAHRCNFIFTTISSCCL
jgi:hypothetical protein